MAKPIQRKQSSYNTTPVMQDSSIVLYSGPRPVNFDLYSLSWYDSSSYDDAGLYGEPLSSTQDGSYDDSYYLTYEEIDCYSSRSWCKNGGTNQDYRGKEPPHSISGTCLGDYTSYFGCYWGENAVYDQGYGAYGSSLEEGGSSLYEGDQHGSYFDYNGSTQPDNSEPQWLGYGGLDFGGGGMEDDFDDYEYGRSSSWGNWEAATLYERIFGH